MTDYVEAFRANLPAGITFDATLNRYFCNDKRYLNEWEVEAYLNYVKKFGFTAISAYAILGLEPPLVLDFEESYFRTDGTATDLVSASTHTRATSATYVDANGILQIAAINEPRVGHHIWNGSAWVYEGYLHESESRVQLLHTTNALVTQSKIVSAVPHTLHFTGTGTVTLSGASTAGPLVGTGTGEENRVSLTFTPTAGTLTVTPSGDVFDAQLEVGSTPSSYIPNLAASGEVTRAADAMTIPAANLPWNPLAVSIQMEGTMTYADTGTSGSGSGGSGDAVFYYWHINAGNYIESFLATNNDQDLISFAQESSGVRDVVNLFFGPTPGINVPFNIASRHGSTFINGAVDGTALTADLTPTALPYLENTDMQIGSTFNGTIKLFRMWADDLTDEGIATGTIADNAFSVSGGYFLTADGEYLIVEET